MLDPTIASVQAQLIQTTQIAIEIIQAAPGILAQDARIMPPDRFAIEAADTLRLLQFCDDWIYQIAPEMMGILST